MDLKHSIGLKVRSARRKRGLTQEGLADAVGKAVETISNLERGQAITGLDTLQEIAGVLEVPIGWFFPDTLNEADYSKDRAEASARIRELCEGLSDKDLQLAAALVTALANHRS